MSHSNALSAFNALLVSTGPSDSIVPSASNVPLTSSVPSAPVVFSKAQAPPCVGCGWCCLTDQCKVSHELYGYSRPCPDIHWDEVRGRYVCLLMQDPEKREQYRKALYQGEGCCARFNPWRGDVRNRGGQS